MVEPGTDRIIIEQIQAEVKLKEATSAPQGTPFGLQGEIPFLIRIFYFISSAFEIKISLFHYVVRQLSGLLILIDFIVDSDDIG